MASICLTSKFISLCMGILSLTALPILSQHSAVTPRRIADTRVAKGIWSAGLLPKERLVEAGDGVQPGVKIYVCRAEISVGGQVIPGMYNPVHDLCVIHNEGQEIDVYSSTIPGYELLVWDVLYEWRASHIGDIPEGALEGGVSSSFEPYYICRGTVFDTRRNDFVTRTGALRVSQGTCALRWGGIQNLTEYEVLVRKSNFDDRPCLKPCGVGHTK